MMMPRLSLFAAAVTLGASTLAAQVATPPAPPTPVPAAPTTKPVGSLPDNSPFRDIGPDGNRFGLVVGYLFTKADEAGVGPKSMPLFGIRHDLHIAGPAYVTTRLLGGSTSRTIVDYTKKPAQRDVGTKQTAMVAGDIGITMSATGDRTWHNLQPLINVGAGIASFTGDLLIGYPLTLHLSAWYAHASILVIGVCAALALYGFRVSLAGRPAFKDLLAEE